MLYYTQEVREMKQKYNRHSIKYRINHFINATTYEDVKRARALIFAAIGEVATCALILFIIFILPSLFH